MVVIKAAEQKLFVKPYKNIYDLILPDRNFLHQIWWSYTFLIK